jgi:hypothetical protein
MLLPIRLERAQFYSSSLKTTESLGPILCKNDVYEVLGDKNFSICLDTSCKNVAQIICYVSEEAIFVPLEGKFLLIA